MAIPSADAVGREKSGVPDALSFDIEDWFHLVEVESVADPASWAALPSLVERETYRLLETLEDAGVRATFFVLGWIAERYPDLVGEIAGAGHELGTHSYWHGKVYDLGREAFRADLRRSMEVLEELTGKPVRGFRAPSFSIVPGCEWAFDVMRALGLRYDASLFPAHRGHGGYPCRPEPHLLPSPGGMEVDLWELPMSVVEVGPLRIPFSGGGYLRALPAWLIRRGVENVHARGRPAVVYLHPRDFAPDCPRVKMPLSRRWKCYTGLSTTRGKLQMLLDRYTFDTCESVLWEWARRRGGDAALPPAAGDPPGGETASLAQEP